MRSRDIDMIPSLFVQNSATVLRIKGKISPGGSISCEPNSGIWSYPSRAC